jgi:cytochrome P450
VNDIPVNGEVVSCRDRFDAISDLDRLRAENPVAKLAMPSFWRKPDSTIWLATRYEDVRSVLGDPRLFSSTPRRLFRPAGGGQPKAHLGLISSDPPEHTRSRQLLAPEFTMRRLSGLMPRVEQIVTECLDVMERKGPPVDLVQEFAQPTSLLTLAALLGMNREEAAEFRHLRNTALDSRGRGGKKVLLMDSSLAGMTKIVARQRAEPGDTLFGRLVRQYGDEFTDDELSGIGSLILVAGYDNMAAMLGLGTLLLLDHPSHVAVLRDDPASADTMIEEMVRYLSVVSAPQGRSATADGRIGDQVIKEGDSVICSLAAANRDDALGNDMDRFDPRRNPVPHVAFGYGVHYCIGAQLARLEMKIAFPALFGRFPELRLAAPLKDLTFRPAPAYCAESIPIAW